MPEALFVGGGTGGGKTTLGRALAGLHGLRLLPIDAFWYEHAERSQETPLPPDVAWLERAPATQAEDFERVSRLMLGYVLEDLPSLPEQPAVLVEGPQVVPDLLPEDALAVFLIPTPRFQRTNLSARRMPSSDPARALANRLVKDRLYADRVAALARERGFTVIDVDGTKPPEEIRARVEEEFSTFLAASEPLDLSGVRRWENEKIVRNVRGWAASGDQRTSSEMTIPFACECGRTGCCERVQLTLSAFDAALEVVAHD
ncbi:MAG TPA: hypothetical protein VH541_07000 [Gaiellaceae bacterium]|jgi:adenylate kinase family enzyme